VTGASSGIGAAYAERLAGDGWDVIVVARRRDRLEAFSERFGQDVEVQVVEADLATTPGLEAVTDVAATVPIDLLVNNAGLAHYMPFSELAASSAAELVDLNVLAPVLLSRAVLPGMIERGSGAVVNLASLLAFSGGWDNPHLPSRAVYAGSRSFVLTFTQLLAAELAGTGVRVQALCPGVVRTEFHSRQGMDLSGRPRMEPEDVVTASLVDLDRGVVVSIPGLDDLGRFESILAAHARLAPVTTETSLPARYTEGS